MYIYIYIQIHWFRDQGFGGSTKSGIRFGGPGSKKKNMLDFMPGPLTWKLSKRGSRKVESLVVSREVTLKNPRDKLRFLGRHMQPNCWA